MSEDFGKATPRPWKDGAAKVEWSVETEGNYASSSSAQIIAKGRKDPVCIVVQADKRFFGDGDAELNANVALIVAAVNGYETALARIAELKKVLLKMRIWLPHMPEPARAEAESLIDATLAPEPQP